MPKKRDHASLRNTSWNVWQNDDNTIPIDQIHLVVLMDIRSELQKLNALLHCENFIGIPRTLRTISRKIPARRAAKAV